MLLLLQYNAPERTKFKSILANCEYINFLDKNYGKNEYRNFYSSYQMMMFFACCCIRHGFGRKIDDFTLGEKFCIRIRENRNFFKSSVHKFH